MATTLSLPAKARTTLPATLPRIGVGVLAILLALLAQRLVQAEHGWDGAALYAAAIALYLLAFPRAMEPLAIGDRPLLRHRTIAWAGAALCAMALVAAAAAAPHFIVDKPTAWGWTLHLASLGALLLGGLALDYGLRPAARGARHGLARGVGAVCACGACVGAAAAQHRHNALWRLA